MNFRNTAMMSDTLACPSARKLCWQVNCAPMTNSVAE